MFLRLDDSGKKYQILNHRFHYNEPKAIEAAEEHASEYADVDSLYKQIDLGKFLWNIIKIIHQEV